MVRNSKGMCEAWGMTTGQQTGSTSLHGYQEQLVVFSLQQVVQVGNDSAKAVPTTPNPEAKADMRLSHTNRE